MPVRSISNQGLSRYHNQYNLCMGGSASEHLAKYLEPEISPVYFLEKDMCQEDKKPGEAVKRLGQSY